MEIVLETTECSRQDPQWDACGMDVGGEDIDLLGLFEECHADELLSSVRDGFVEAETRPTSFDQDSSLKIRHDQHCDVNSLREQSSSPSSSDWASESSTQCHSNEQPPRHTLSLESCGGQKRVELVLSEAERADDKKRRNRDAARVCRAKKKRNIQVLLLPLELSSHLSSSDACPLFSERKIMF